MSLFKARQWWNTTVGDDETFDLGCLCVANIDNNNNGLDKLIVGSFHGFLRIYNPRPVRNDTGGNGGFRPEDVVCEMQLPQPILQVEAGRFVSASAGLHLAVLHPRKLAVYSLAASSGTVEHGTHYTLKLAYEQNLQRTSFNFCYGPFGGVKNKDFICVQSMDGTVSVFEQESFAFTRFLPGALLPGPLKYVAKTDSFITVSSGRQVESYKYQVLAVATDAKTKEESLNIKSGKRVVYDWMFNLGEQALDLTVVNFTNAPPCIYILGERNLFTLTEGGKLKLTKKMEYNPSCFLPFQSAVDNSVNVLVGTHTKTLMVYQDTTLKWAAQLENVAVQAAIANFSDLRGVIVTLDEGGRLDCSYLGTDPAMFAPPSAEVRELDYGQMDEEMRQLQRVIKEQQAKSVMPLPNAKADEDIQIQIHVPPNLDSPSLAQDVEFQDEDPVPSITVKVEVIHSVSLKAKSHINDVRLSIHVRAPLTVNESLLAFSSIEPGRPIETQVTFYMKSAILPADLRAEVTANFLSVQGAPRVISAVIRLPLKLVLKPCLPVKTSAFKITIDTNKPPASLTDLFPDLLGDSAGGGGSALGFQVYGMEPVITLLAAKSSQRYRLQCDNFASIWVLLSDLVARLSSHFRKGRGSDFKISYDGSLPLTEYFDVLDAHFTTRQTEDTYTTMMADRASQFRAVQRRLLTRFKDKTPAPLANLDTLLDGTYRQLLALAEKMEENRAYQRAASAELSCATRTLNLLISLWQDMTPTEVAVLESALTPDVNSNGSQGWEEMVDAAVTHLLRTCLAKSSKDTTVNPAPLGLLKETTKLKKHIALICDRLGKGAKLVVEGHAPVLDPSPASTPPARHTPSSTSPSAPSKPLPTTLDPSPIPPPGTLGEASTPTGSKFGESKKPKKSPRTGPRADREPRALADGGLRSLAGPLPPLGGGGGTIDTSTLPPLTEQGNKFLKKKSVTESVPDLDDLGTPGEDEDTLLNGGGNELVYGL